MNQRFVQWFLKISSNPMLFFSPFISNMFKLHIMLIKCLLLLFNALSRSRILLINMFELSILIRSKLFIIQFFKSASYYICYINISRKNTQCFSETSQRSKILRRMKSFLYFLRKQFIHKKTSQEVQLNVRQNIRRFFNTI